MHVGRRDLFGHLTGRRGHSPFDQTHIGALSSPGLAPYVTGLPARFPIERNRAPGQSRATGSCNIQVGDVIEGRGECGVALNDIFGLVIVRANRQAIPPSPLSKRANGGPSIAQSSARCKLAVRCSHFC
jgi:hypothetical protein